MIKVLISLAIPPSIFDPCSFPDVNQMLNAWKQMSGIEEKDVFPPLCRIRQQVIGRRQEKSVAAVKHGEVFQVVVGIADQCIEDHLPEKHWDINLWLATVLAHQGEKIRVAKIVPTFPPGPAGGEEHSVGCAPDSRTHTEKPLRSSPGDRGPGREWARTGLCSLQ